MTAQKSPLETSYENALEAPNDNTGGAYKKFLEVKPQRGRAGGGAESGG